MNCKPGDLATIVEAFNACNLGIIVRVTGRHVDQSALVAPSNDTIWVVESSHLLTYDIAGRLSRKKRGPAPDSQLKPIRGLPEISLGKAANKRPIKGCDLVTKAPKQNLSGVMS